MNSFRLQVCAHTVQVMQEIAMVSKWNLSVMASADMIIAASHSQQYLLLRLQSRRAVLLQEAAGGVLGTPVLQEVQGAGDILNPNASAEAQIAACCLYHDTSGWLRSSLQQLASSTTVCTTILVILALQFV